MSTSRHPSRQQPRWELDAACRPHPTSWWFAADEPEAVEAFLICQGCHVAEQCLTFALDHPSLVGVWAGTSAQDRARLRAERRRHERASRPDPEHP